MFDQAIHVNPYEAIDWIEAIDGYIVWRVGTGLNVELLHIRTYADGCGAGRRLLSAMVDKLKACPPYHTVFGFTRTCNHAARQFYAKMGFVLTEVTGVYADGSAVVFSQPFAELLERIADADT